MLAHVQGWQCWSWRLPQTEQARQWVTVTATINVLALTLGLSPDLLDSCQVWWLGLFQYQLHRSHACLRSTEHFQFVAETHFRTAQARQEVRAASVMLRLAAGEHLSNMADSETLLFTGLQPSGTRLGCMWLCGCLLWLT